MNDDEQHFIMGRCLSFIALRKLCVKDGGELEIVVVVHIRDFEAGTGLSAFYKLIPYISPVVDVVVVNIVQHVERSVYGFFNIFSVGSKA